MSITSMVEHAIQSLAKQHVDLIDYEIVMNKRTLQEFAKENNAFLNFKENERSQFWGLPIRLSNYIEYKKIYITKSLGTTNKIRQQN